MRDLLRDAGTRIRLKAGCGSASVLHDFGLDRWGFDLILGVFDAIRRLLAEQGLLEARL